MAVSKSKYRLTSFTVVVVDFIVQTNQVGGKIGKSFGQSYFDILVNYYLIYFNHTNVHKITNNCRKRAKHTRVCVSQRPENFWTSNIAVFAYVVLVQSDRWLVDKVLGYNSSSLN